MNRPKLTEYPSVWWMVFVELWRVIGIWENRPPPIRAMFRNTPGIDTCVYDYSEELLAEVRKIF